MKEQAICKIVYSMCFYTWIVEGKNTENACSVPKWKNINKDLFSIEVKEPVFYRGKETPTEK